MSRNYGLLTVTLLRFDLTLAIADRPGRLINALSPIAKNGGNIISIVHEREKHVEGTIPVNLLVDFPSKWNLKKTIEDLRSLGVVIIKSQEIVDITRTTLILIGSIDLKNFFENNIKIGRVVGFEVSTPNSKNACMKLDVEVETSLVEESLKKLKMISKEENIMLISSI